MRRSIRKQLTCPACGVVLAGATYRRLPPRLTVVSAGGVPLAPAATSVVLRQLRAELADAGPGREQPVTGSSSSSATSAS